MLQQKVVLMVVLSRSTRVWSYIGWMDGGWMEDGGWNLAGWNEYLMEALTEVRHRASRSTSRYFVLLLISILELSDFTERLDLFSLLRMLFEDT